MCRECWGSLDVWGMQLEVGVWALVRGCCQNGWQKLTYSVQGIGDASEGVWAMDSAPQAMLPFMYIKILLFHTTIYVYINPHLTGVRKLYVIMMMHLCLDRIWHEHALSILGHSSILAALHAQHMLKCPVNQSNMGFHGAFSGKLSSSMYFLLFACSFGKWKHYIITPKHHICQISCSDLKLWVLNVKTMYTQ